MTGRADLQQAVQVLREGGVVAYPTEGVWGLGCDPANAAATARVIEAKQRDWRKGLILIAAEFEMLRAFVEVPSAAALARAEATWPGPVTWIFPVSAQCPELVRGEHDTIAVRVTAHPVAAALSQAFDAPLVSTSANRAGAPAALSSDDVRQQLGTAVDAIVEGPLGGLAGPTAICDVITGDYLRRPA